MSSVKNSKEFSAGRLKYFYKEWNEITTDINILEIVQGCKIEFIDDIAPVLAKSYEPRFNESETDCIDKEINNLLEIGAIVKANFDPSQFLSTIFVRPKKNGEFRVILNLKNLNGSVPYRHFKMDTFESAVNLVSKSCYMASIDIRHAYHSIPIAEEYQKLLRFRWKKEIFQYTCLPFGLASAPRIFTKILKPVFAKLRLLGHISVAYIDDILVYGDSETECNNNLIATRQMLEKLGFVIHDKKCVFKPSNQIIFLGNIIDSETMVVKLTDSKKNAICQECKALLHKSSVKIRVFARVIGLIISSFSAVELGLLHYRTLEKEKTKYLKEAKGNFESTMPLSANVKNELMWWTENIYSQKRIISRGNPEATIKTDASLLGWGAVYDTIQTGGRWKSEEMTHHINYLEMLAIFFALQSFENHITNKYVRILSDNTTAISYINKMGGIKSECCNDLAVEIWNWCLDRNIWLLCSHIPGKINNEADKLSREFSDQTEWHLDHDIFLQICSKFYVPDIDLFASRLNKQLDTFCSWKPDPECSFVNAFSLNWENFNFVYLFPPFSLLSLCIKKVQDDKARGMIIAPLWPTQAWFTKLMRILVAKPILLPRKGSLLTNPMKETLHPLRKKIVLLACQVSGKRIESMEFQKNLPPLLWHHGEPVLKNNIKLSLRDGFSTALNGKLIQFHLL